MRSVRAVIVCLLAALTMSGSMRKAAPVAMVSGQEGLTRADNSDSYRLVVPLGTNVSPGDTVLVGERWS